MVYWQISEHHLFWLLCLFVLVATSDNSYPERIELLTDHKEDYLPVFYQHRV